MNSVFTDTIHHRLFDFVQDWDGQEPTQIVTEVCGFITILSGTFLLHKTKDMADGFGRLPKYADENCYESEGIPLRSQESFSSP